MSDNIVTTEEDTFEISFRILGNEIFAMELASKSRHKNWAVFGLIVLVMITLFVNQLIPLVLLISEFMV